jgi:hypothetical protein
MGHDEIFFAYGYNVIIGEDKGRGRGGKGALYKLVLAGSHHARYTVDVCVCVCVCMGHIRIG